MQSSTTNCRFTWPIAALLFVTLLGSYAYFWQARGWNNGSRLMLTYALGDRSTVCIDGLEGQTGDLAFVNGHYYCDKPFGQSFAGLPFYLMLKPFGAVHPLGSHPIRYWWPDYVLTVATSGVLTAAIGVLLYSAALNLGCRQGPAVLVALCYGLATPAWPFATLFFGHQTAAFLLFAALAILAHCERRQAWSARWMFAAGFLAGYAVLTDYPAVVTAAGLMVYAFESGCSLRGMVPFVISAGACAAFLAGYNQLAFGGPLQLGYFHEHLKQFQAIYSSENPIGLTRPSAARAIAILLSAHRGLVWYAPAVVLAPVGLWMLWRQKHYRYALLVVVAFGSYFLLNAAHPTWDAGASTGPRYLLASLPFLMLAVAATVAGDARYCKVLLGWFVLNGFLICGSCTATTPEGRLPNYGLPGGDDPLRTIVLRDVLEGRFGPRNLGNLLLHGRWEIWTHRNWSAMVPLLGFQLVMVSLIAWRCRRAEHHTATACDESRSQSHCGRDAISPIIGGMEPL